MGEFAAQSVLVTGVARVIATDHWPHRLELARQMGADVVNFRETHVGRR